MTSRCDLLYLGARTAVAYICLPALVRTYSFDVRSLSGVYVRIQCARIAAGRRCKRRPLWPTLIGHRVPRGQPTNRTIRSAMINMAAIYITRFVLFFKDCDSSSGITNLRHALGTISICLKMNTRSLKKIDGLPAKFLGNNIPRA